MNFSKIWVSFVNQFKNWKKNELIYFLIILSIILSSSIILLILSSDLWYINLFTFIASISGILSMIQSYRKNSWLFFWSIISAIFLGICYIFWNSLLQTFLQFIVFIPIFLYSWIRWFKENEIENVNSYNIKNWILIIEILLGLMVATGIFLIIRNNDDKWINQLDDYSSSLYFVFGIIASFLLIFRINQSWVFWIFTNLFSTFLLITKISMGEYEAIIFLITQLVYLFNSIFSFNKWLKIIDK